MQRPANTDYKGANSSGAFALDSAPILSALAERLPQQSLSAGVGIASLRFDGEIDQYDFAQRRGGFGPALDHDFAGLQSSRSLEASINSASGTYLRPNLEGELGEWD